MHQYLHAGTSLFDGRTRRARHIKQGTAAYIGSQLNRLYHAGDTVKRGDFDWEGNIFARTRGVQKKIHKYYKPRFPRPDLAHELGHRYPQSKRLRAGKTYFSTANQPFSRKFLSTTTRADREYYGWMPRRRRQRRWRKHRRPYRMYGSNRGRTKIGNHRTGGFMHMKSNVIPGELKFTNHENVSDNFTTSWATMDPGTEGCLSAVAQGDGENQRDGRVYYIKSIHIHGEVNTVALETDAGPLPEQYARFCVVLDKQTNGAQLAANLVMKEDALTDDHFAFRNLQHSRRFTILMDKTIIVRHIGQMVVAANQYACPIKRLPFKYHHVFNPPLKINTKGTTAVIASMTENSLHMIGITNATTPTIALSYQVRIRFLG